jgi:DMSO/TMAO reductase YedYZ heme-binding membrane subunit
MAFLGALTGVIAFSLLCKKPIERKPWVFYMVALALTLLYLALGYIGLPTFVNRYIYLVMQKCTLAVSFFVVVMFLGTLKEGSKLRNYLMPIRGELSIIGSILALAHAVRYLMSFIPIVFNESTNTINIVISLFLAILLIVLLLLLGGTSFNFIKKRMHAKTWKSLQKLAYPFFFLTYIHLVLFLLPAALDGGGAAQVSLIAYSLVFMLYVMARSAAVLRKKKAASITAPQLIDLKSDI